MVRGPGRRGHGEGGAGDRAGAAGCGVPRIARSAARFYLRIRPAGGFGLAGSRWRCWCTWRTASAGRSRNSPRRLAGWRRATWTRAWRYGRDDEIGRAGHAFNDMAARLKESTEPPGLSHPDGKLADAGAQDGARGEELAHPHPPHRGRDAGAPRRGRPRLHGAGRADRGGGGGEPGAAHPRVFAVRRRAAGAPGARWT